MQDLRLLTAGLQITLFVLRRSMYLYAGMKISEDISAPVFMTIVGVLVPMCMKQYFTRPRA